MAQEAAHSAQMRSDSDAAVQATEHGAHWRSWVEEHPADWYSPAPHVVAEQSVQEARSPAVAAKVPAAQATHVPVEPSLQPLRYWPAGHEAQTPVAAAV